MGVSLEIYRAAIGVFNQCFLLKCPRYTAPRQNLLSSAAQMFDNNWYLLSNLEKVDIFLHGSTNLDMLDNLNLFMFVQQYIKETKRFLQ